MRIKEIELDNFKSFGEITTIPMLPGFTTVSGPNGSGKSNVVDSLMFALGLTSTRNMRAERLTDLLNNLTGRKECSVKVTFVEDASGQELQVERTVRVKTNGYDSKYMLNGEPSTLTQIHDKLGHYNISPRGFNVVMQGDVASIISMNSVDRRKIVDEIAGVAEFDRKIELANRELTTVLERIQSQEIILKELKERLATLQTERDQAVIYAELKERRTELEKQFLAVRIKQIRDEEARTGQELEDLKKLRNDLQIENNTINEDMARMQNELNQISAEIEELGEGRQKQLGLMREDCKENLAREESSLEYVLKQIEDQQAQQRKLEKEIKALKDSLKSIDFKENEFSQEVATIEVNIREEEATYLAMQAKIRSKSATGNVSTQAVIETQDKANKLKEEKSGFENEKARLEEQIKLINEDLNKHKNEAEKFLERLEEIRRKSGGAMDLDALKEQINFQLKNLEALKEEHKETREETINQERKLRAVQSKLDQLEGQEQAEGAAGFGRAVEMVLKMDGVHGTLVQLGSVDPKYQVAVETAAGARLRAVVVDDDYVAQECIETLRDNKAGRATFLPLNKLKEARSYPLPQDSGVIGWALDLIEYQDQYKDAFAYAFADTLVVKNIEVGRRMIGRYRMVTMQGDMLERSGAMTGGAAVKSNIHFGTSTDSQFKRLNEEKLELENFIAKLASEERALEQQIEETRAKLDKLKEQLGKREAETGVSGVQTQTLEEGYEKSKTAVSEASWKVFKIEEQMELLNDKIFKKDQEIQKQDSKMQELAAEMRDSGLEAIVNESQEIEVEIKRYRAMLNNLLNESKGLEAEKNFAMQSIDRIQTELTESATAVAELEAKKPLAEERMAAIKVDIDKITAEIEEIRISLSEMQAKRNQVSEQLLGLGQRRGELKSLIESTAIRAVETKKKLITVQEHLATLLEELKEHPELEGIELPEEDLNKLQAELTRIEKKMRSMEPVNMRAVEEYEEVARREAEIVEKQQSLTDERQMLLDKINSYTAEKKEAFMESYTKINEGFQEIFADLSFGQGQLILEDPEEVFNGGLIIKAQPRGKKMQRLEAMSGGEKSLTALSFLFSLQQCNPAPFYAFDEVDSALDGVNVDRLARKIRRNSATTQFIVVTHRRPMLDQSDRAVGVSVGKTGFSKVIGVKQISEMSAREDEEQLVAA